MVQNNFKEITIKKEDIKPGIRKFISLVQFAVVFYVFGLGVYNVLQKSDAGVWQILTAIYIGLYFVAQYEISLKDKAIKNYDDAVRQLAVLLETFSRNSFRDPLSHFPRKEDKTKKKVIN